MSIDLELVITARNYAVKAEQELLKARKHWKERFQALDDELQSLYQEKQQLEQALSDCRRNFEDYKLNKHPSQVKQT